MFAQEEVSGVEIRGSNVSRLVLKLLRLKNLRVQPVIDLRCEKEKKTLYLATLTSR